MKRQALKAKRDYSFWSYEKWCKGFSKINDNVKSSLQKWIIYHPHMIQSTIVNYYITVNFYDKNGGVNTELCHKVLLQVSVHELHIEILKDMLLGFPWHIMKKDLFILFIMLFDYFFHQNYKIRPRSIKLYVVAKYSSRLEHTKSGPIIGVSGERDI